MGTARGGIKRNDGGGPAACCCGSNTRQPGAATLFDGFRHILVNVDLHRLRQQRAPSLQKSPHGRIAGNPTMRAFLQTWRTLLSQAVEIDVYEDVTEAIE